MAHKAKWTVLTYIAAHNNLDALGKKSLDEILRVGSSDDVVHGVFYDGPVGAARYVMGDPGYVKYQQQLGKSFDSGDPDELIATAKWLFDQYPAQRYALVLWSHGSGWEPAEIAEVAKEARSGAQADPAESQERAGAPGGRALFRSTLRTILKPDKPSERAILFDDGTGHSLDTIELARVARAIAKAIGQPLDLLGMDACLMANLEVAYEVRKDVRYLVASQELVPGHSWPYQTIFGALRANPDLGGAQFAKLVVEQYVGFYSANPPAAGDVTKVALDLGRIVGGRGPRAAHHHHRRGRGRGRRRSRPAVAAQLRRRPRARPCRGGRAPHRPARRSLPGARRGGGPGPAGGAARRHL